MSYARKIAYNTVIQFAGRFATTLTSLAMVSILNSGLRPEGWGQYIAATTYIGFFAVLADMGINTYYLREISRYPEKSEKLRLNFLAFAWQQLFFVGFGALGHHVSSRVPGIDRGNLGNQHWPILPTH